MHRAPEIVIIFVGDWDHLVLFGTKGVLILDRYRSPESWDILSVTGTPLLCLEQREFSCWIDIGHLKHETFR